MTMSLPLLNHVWTTTFLIQPLISLNRALQHFAENYSMPRQGGEPKPRNKKVVVIVRPHISSDPDGPNYEQCCKQRLMLNKPFRNETELLNGHETVTEAYAD